MAYYFGDSVFVLIDAEKHGISKQTALDSTVELFNQLKSNESAALLGLESIDLDLNLEDKAEEKKGESGSSKEVICPDCGLEFDA